MNKDIQSSRDKRRLAMLDQVGDASRVNQGSTDLFDERVGAFLGINRTDGRCLDIIGRLGRISAGQLANDSGLTTGAVTAVIDRLEAAGYVQRIRDPHDRRKIWVECTPHINQLIETIFGVYAVLGPVMLRHFTDEQLAGILTFLRIGTRMNRLLAEGLQEHTKAGAAPAQRLAQAAAFRRAIDLLIPGLTEEFEALSPGLDADAATPPLPPA